MNWWVKSIKRFIPFRNIEHYFTLVSTITECVSISDFASLVDIQIGITSSAVGLRICAITAAIKTYESIRKNKRSIMK